MLCPRDIIWETEESTLSDFEYKYGNNLPQLFMVCDGFDGNELLHSFESEETFVVVSVATQSRVVLHDSSSRLLSVPLTCQLPVRTVNSKRDKASKPQSLKAVMAEIASMNFSSNSIVFANNPQVAIQRGASEVIQCKCGIMDIVDLHQQKYLVGYSVMNGKIDPTPVLMPSYVPIHVTVAGMEGGAEEAARWLSDITPPGDNFNVEDHFNTEIMAVSFSDIEGDGYEYVNPASKHQTLSRITAKVNGLRRQNAASLSLPKEWVDNSQELSEALNAPPQSFSSLTSCTQQGTSVKQDTSESDVILRRPKDDMASTDSRFLGGMKSISMIDLSQAGGAGLSIPRQECPAKKYMRKSEHFHSKSNPQSSRSSSEESINVIHKLPEKEKTKGKSKPTLAPKPKNLKDCVPKKQQHQEMFEEMKKKDRKKSQGSLEAEFHTSDIFSKSSRVPSLRNAKSMTDLSSLAAAQETTSVKSLKLFDFKSRGKKADDKKSKTVTAITAGQKKKKRPFLLRLFSGSSWNTDIVTAGPTAEEPQTDKKCKSEKLAKSTNAGKYKRNKSTSDIEIAAQIAAMRGESESPEGGGSVYADIPDSNTVDLLSDIRKAKAEREKPKPGKFVVNYNKRNPRAPALPPRNNETPEEEPLSPPTENPYECLPDRGESIIKRNKPDKKRQSSAPVVPKSPTASDSSSFVFEFDPTSASYGDSVAGHVTEFDSGGETSGSDTGASSDVESGSSADENKLLKQTNQRNSAALIRNTDKPLLEDACVKDDIPDYRPPPPKPRPVSCGIALPSISSRIKALTKDSDLESKVSNKLAQDVKSRQRGSVVPKPNRANLSAPPPPPPADNKPHLPSPPSNRTSIASSVSEAGGLNGYHGNNLIHQESGYWSQSDNSYSDGSTFAPVLPPPRPFLEHAVTSVTPATHVTSVSSDVSSKYRTWADIPDDISDLTVEDVVESLKLLKMTRYADAFSECDVDGELLSDLDEGVLQEDFGFSSFDAKKLVKFAKGWRPKLK